MASRSGSCGWSFSATSPCVLALALSCGAGACGGEKFTAAASDDGGTGNDASGLDASSDAASTGFCDGLPDKHFFCDDWDKGDIKSGWDTQAESRYAAAKLDSVAFRSAPRSFNATTTHSVSVPEETTAILEKDIGHLRQATLEFDLAIDAFGADPSRGDLDLAALTVLTLGNTSYVLAALTGSQMTFVESLSADAGGAVQQHPLGGTLAQGAWVHVKMVIDVGVTGHVTITFDGKTVLDSSLTVPVGSNVSAQLFLGLSLKHAPNLWNVHYDNLIVDKQ
jgi:hypothetical protein